MIPAQNRLRRQSDFTKVLKGGYYIGSRSMTFKFRPNNLAKTRVGLVVSRKVSPKAVVRNRLRRRLAAVLRENLPKLSQNIDLVIIGSPRVKDFPFTRLRAEVQQALSRGRLLSGPKQKKCHSRTPIKPNYQKRKARA